MTTSAMDDVALLVAQSQCRELVLAAAQAVDSQDYEALIRLFAEDAVVQRPTGQPLKGRAEILASYQSKNPDRLTRHVVSNHRIEVQSAGLAISHCTVVLYASDVRHPIQPQGRLSDSAPQVGQIVDRMVLQPQGWRIQERKAWFDMQVIVSP